MLSFTAMSQHFLPNTCDLVNLDRLQTRHEVKGNEVTPEKSFVAWMSAKRR